MFSLIRIVLGILLGLVLVASLLAAAGRWLFLYDADLPNVQELSLFAPEAPTVVPEAYICNQTARVVAIPTKQIPNVRNALFAAEGNVDLRSVTRRLYEDVVGDAARSEHYGAYSLQIARQFFCDDRRNAFRHQLSELRTSAQLERHFTTDQILDIYLNRALLGPGVYGIENASEHYFAKPAAQLSTAEAALLAGMIRSPSMFEPYTHPMGALGRRNEVIEAMAKRGSISPQQAQEAKSEPLPGIAANSAPDH